MDSTKIADDVNEKHRLLLVDGTPQVHTPDGKIITIPDSYFGRWFIRANFQQICATDDAAVWLAKPNPLYLESIAHLNSAPKPYQILALNRMTISNCALWLDMGLGKTFVSLAFAMREYQKGKGNIFLIVCPVSVFVTWQDEIALHIAESSQPRIIVAHGPKKKKKLQELRLQPSTAPTFIISSYETISTIIDDFKFIPIHAIFYDESSKVKNTRAVRTKAAHRLVKHHPTARRFCLSGTPSTNDPLGFYSQYELLGKGFSGSPDQTTFEATYADTQLFARCLLPSGRTVHVPCDSDTEMHDWLFSNCPFGQNTTYGDLGYRFNYRAGEKQLQVIHKYRRKLGFKNLKQLQQVTHTHAYCLQKTDVLDDLPPKTYVRRSVQMTAEQKKAYNEIIESNRTAIGELVIRFDANASPYARLHQIANGFLNMPDGTTHDFANDPKLSEIHSILDESGDQKIVIWCAYRRQIAQITEFIKGLNMECCVIHGGVRIEERPDIVHRFQELNGPRVLVANPATAGMGLNLTCATIEIFASIWFAADVRDQAEDRLHRIGQKNAVTVIDLLAEGTLELKLLRDTRRKISVQNKIITLSDLKGE